MLQSNLLFYILFWPLLSAIILSVLNLFIKKELRSQILFDFLSVAGVSFSAVISLYLAYQNYVFSFDFGYNIYTFLDLESLKIDFALKADALSLMMLSFVNPVGTAIFFYALAYMRDDRSSARFFIYFNLFIFFMNLLVLGANPFIMFLGWEGVGIMSYLLIGFYYDDFSNIKAANKAFILNRIGDFGFLSGIFLLAVFIGVDGYSFEALSESYYKIEPFYLNLIAILLFVGAMGKSAQIPLYVWLPDAMAGPTPVSALIHAATMVTAGVYMVARFSDLFSMVEEVGVFIAYIGAFSALLAALIATKTYDIKKILAYSTMSQLGYMFMAEGLGNYSYALFHVFTHSFFKATLFMGAGAIILALHHEQDIRKMGNLKDKMPALFYMMLVAALSISAIFPFSGFFSKDAIMLHLFSSGHYLIYFIALFTSFLTAFYMFRFIFYIFFSHKRDIEVKATSKLMLIPIGVLSFFTIIVGFLNTPELLGGDERFSLWLSLFDQRYFVSHLVEISLIVINTVFILLAIFLAYLRFYKLIRLEDEASTLSKLLSNAFYVDKIYNNLFTKPLHKLSCFADEKCDIGFIDKLINSLAFGYIKISKKFSVTQNGSLNLYMLVSLGGVSLMMIYILVVLL